MSFWKELWRRRVSDWTFGVLESSQVPDGLGHNPIEPEAMYINIFLRSMRVLDVRKGLKKFYGTVHSFISIPHIRLQRAEFHVLTTPSELSDIDAKNVDRIIHLNNRLLGPVPYRGGDVDMDLGLFSVESVDLAGPFLNVLEGIANAAGVSYINAAIPFVKPLNDGVNLLLGIADSTILEVGLSTTFDKLFTGYFVVMRAPKNTFNLASLKLDKDYRLIDENGEAITKYPYMVFSIESSPQRVAWFEIPEIAKAHNEIQEAVRTGNVNTAKEAFTMFKRITLTSPDLLTADAINLVKKVKTKLDNTLEALGTTRKDRIDFPNLKEIDLYE